MNANQNFSTNPGLRPLFQTRFQRAFKWNISSILVFGLICRVLTRLLYRLKVIGRENIPAHGAAVLVCNHVTFIDFMFILSSSPRPVRFVMHYSFLNIPLMSGLFRAAGVIPIAGAKEAPEILEAAFSQISRNLKIGEIVCIFPEGKITTDGKMNRFKPGINRILKENRVPVIPIALNGLWGSFFSRKDGMALRRPFRRIRSRISLVIGEAVSPENAGTRILFEQVSRLKSCCTKIQAWFSH
jgi:1-acyl-sn-glycerol-3-phosphate acyltransferase